MIHHDVGRAQAVQLEGRGQPFRQADGWLGIQEQALVRRADLHNSHAAMVSEVGARIQREVALERRWRGHLRANSFTYGMHHCVNLVCGPPGVASAVLLRAGEVVDGLEVARSRRPGVDKDHALARGPANLVRALALGPADNAHDMCIPGPLHLEGASAGTPFEVRTGPRVGVRLGAETPWRFWIADDPTVSAYRPAAAKRAR